MEQSLKQKIASDLNDYAKEKGLSNNDIARLSGVNAGYLSNILRNNFSNEVNGKESPIGDRHFYKLAEFIGLAVKKMYWQLEPTRQFQEIITTLAECKVDCKTALIIANTGLGKQTPLILFVKKILCRLTV